MSFKGLIKQRRKSKLHLSLWDYSQKVLSQYDPKEKKTSTLAPTTLSKSTEGVRFITKALRQPFLCKNALLPTILFDDRLAISGLPALPWRLCGIQNPFCSGMNPPGLSQIDEDVIRHKR
jgi:hypothetical protein